MSKIFVLGTAVIFLVYGVLFFVIPIATFEFVVNGSVTSSSAVTDIRASYGGMSVGIGIILWMLGTNERTLRLGLQAVCIVMLGMALGRSIGIVVDGNTNQFMYIYFVLELIASIVSLTLIKFSNQTKNGDKLGP